MLLAATVVCSTRWSCGASLGPNEPLLGADRTFVLISGLPGDVESETAYQDQQQAWLEVLTAGPRAKRCVVFGDRPSSAQQKSSVPTEFFKADREHVLALPQTLGAITGPVRFIVWGHGGKQGDTPVLHVHGPRLTPADFSSLSSKLPDVPSQWILIFRGSGAFGRALAGPGRQVLASDDETISGSDPNSMPLLLKVVRAHPDEPFGELMEQFGQVTADWYVQRGLAPAEEPTFWADGGELRHLGEQPNRFRVGTQTQQEAIVPQTGSTSRPPSSVTRHPAADAWSSVKRVSKEDYPDADAVVLRSRYISVLGNSPALTTEREEFVQILKPEGKRFGDFDISFAPPEEEVEFLDCEVMQPDGGLERLDPESIDTAVEHSPEEYQTVRRKFFSLPGVGPGAVLHVRYRSQWRDFPLPHVSMEIPLSRNLPVLDATVVIRSPKGSSLHYHLEGAPPVEPGVEQTEYSTSYTWHLTNIAPALAESLAPPHRAPALLVSTFADWRAFAEWYAHITQLTSEVTPELERKAKEITREARTPRQKVEALFNYVTGLRYVAIPLGVNSLRPHAAANVLQNQFGDCKDKANLLNALLHALDIEANLVLVPRFTQAHPSLPGLWFNHAISRVSAGGEVFWIDSTDEVCRFGLLPPGDAGRNGLVIDGRTTSLTPIRASNADQNRWAFQGKINCAQQSNGCPLELKVAADGYADYQLRSASAQGRESRELTPLLAAAFRPVAGSFALEQQQATPVSTLEQGFKWQARGQCVGLLSTANPVLHSPFWVPKEWDLALHARKSPLFLDEGYPLVLEEEFQIALSPDTEIDALPQPRESSSPPLSWRVEWKHTGDRLDARFRAELSQANLSWSETVSFQRQLNELLQTLGSDVLLFRPRPLQDSFKATQN
ncbi:MAG TPA: DUF3857 domain-containing protein [Verrucomicrobiae bacterium]|nr:DUF3857 domain-containing protein [Verrucomicrobiae bacterium]